MTSASHEAVPAFVHPTADVHDSVIGLNSRVLQYAIVAENCDIGENTIIHPHCVLQPGVVIGDDVTIHCGVHIATGTRIEDQVSIGANSAIAGRSGQTSGEGAHIKVQASIGFGVTISAGVEVGQMSLIDDGSVVTGNVPPGARVCGNPATIQGYRDRESFPVRLHQPSDCGIPGVGFLQLQQVQDLRGTLTVCQWDQQLPFVPQRIFFLHGVPNEKVRGAHAHRECMQFLVCINGSVNVLVDDGIAREEFVLRSASEGLLIPPGIWATQYKYSASAMLAVIASHNYAAEDYIRDYQEFRERASSQ